MPGRLLLALALLAPASVPAQQDLPTPQARFKSLALACIHQEYPNKLTHVLMSDADVLPPRELTPVFYGCYDWHSAVHGHWLLVRWLRLHPEEADAAQVDAALEASFQAGNVAGELEYLAPDPRASFERPYGAAWLLQLMAELREWDDPRAARWRAVLAPLEAAYVERMSDWLRKLAYPIRIGEHAQTAFAFALFLDWAEASGDQAFYSLVSERARAFYLGDVNCPLDYEPGGQDFLSPCLAEADLVRRVLNRPDYAAWLSGFLPGIPTDGSAAWLPLAAVTDRSDGKLAHLDGLHLSRAWALFGMAAGLPPSDPRLPAILAAAHEQAEAGLAAVTGEHYEGGHWLGSFATYLVTGRGTGIDPELKFELTVPPSPGTAPPPDAASLQDFARRYTEAWCSQDPQSVAAFFAETGSLQINDGEPARGRVAIADAAHGFMTDFPDLEVRMDELRIGDLGAEYHWTLTGTHSGSGRSVEISGYEQWTFDSSGLIAGSLGHFDAEEYARQVGKDDG